MKLHIGKYIREQRFLNNLTQADLARLMKVDARTISSWETDRTEPKQHQVQQLCKIFDCSQYDLTGIPTASAQTLSITPQDKAILELYHSLNDEQKNKALLYMLGLKTN